MNPEEEVDDEPEVLLCVEKDTRLLYEVQYFDGFALVRPASPAFRGLVEQVEYGKFIKLFEEYLGNPEDVQTLLYGHPEEPLITERTKK